MSVQVCTDVDLGIVGFDNGGLRRVTVMKKTLTGLIVVVFTGLLCTSLVTIFKSDSTNQHHAPTMLSQYPYFVTY